MLIICLVVSVDAYDGESFLSCCASALEKRLFCVSRVGNFMRSTSSGSKHREHKMDGLTVYRYVRHTPATKIWTFQGRSRRHMLRSRTGGTDLSHSLQFSFARGSGLSYLLWDLRESYARVWSAKRVCTTGQLTIDARSLNTLTQLGSDSNFPWRPLFLSCNRKKCLQNFVSRVISSSTGRLFDSLTWDESRRRLSTFQLMTKTP